MSQCYGQKLAALGTAIAIQIANGVSADEANILGALFNVIGDQLALIAASEVSTGSSTGTGNNNNDSSGNSKSESNPDDKSKNNNETKNNENDNSENKNRNNGQWNDYIRNSSYWNYDPNKNLGLHRSHTTE